MRFEEIMSRCDKKEITKMEAADILGISERTFLRKRIRYEEEGINVQFDKRLGKKAGKCAMKEEVEMITKLYKERYQGFSVRHFYTFARHNLRYSYTWFKNTLQSAGLITKGKKGGLHRQRRERKPMAGMCHKHSICHGLWQRLKFHCNFYIIMIKYR